MGSVSPQCGDKPKVNERVKGGGRARGRGAPCPSPAPGPPGSRGGRGKTWAPDLGSVWWSRSRCRPRSAGPSGMRRRPLPARAVRDPARAAVRRQASGRARGAWGQRGGGWGVRGKGPPRRPVRSRHPLPARPSPGRAAAPPSWAAAAAAARVPPGWPISRQGESGRPISGGGAEERDGSTPNQSSGTRAVEALCPPSEAGLPKLASSLLVYLQSKARYFGLGVG